MHECIHGLCRSAWSRPRRAPTVGEGMTAEATIADPQASTSISALVDEITRRSIERSISELGPPPCPLTWFALGSHGRREPAPGSDIDSALAWDGDEDDEEARSYMHSLGSRVSEALALERLCSRRARGDRRAGPLQSPRQRLAPADPRVDRGSDREQGLDRDLAVLGRPRDLPGGRRAGPPAGVRDGESATGAAAADAEPGLGAEARGRPPARVRPRALRRAPRPARHQAPRAAAGDDDRPLCEPRGRCDCAPSTPARLAAASAAGTRRRRGRPLSGAAFELFHSLRLEHQAEQLERGIEPDDFLDPKALEPANAAGCAMRCARCARCRGGSAAD